LICVTTFGSTSINEAIQLGTDTIREKLSNKPEMGHTKKANTEPKRLPFPLLVPVTSTISPSSKISAPIT